MPEGRLGLSRKHTLKVVGDQPYFKGYLEVHQVIKDASNCADDDQGNDQ